MKFIDYLNVNQQIFSKYVKYLFVHNIKVVRVDWFGNLANYKKDYNVSLFHVVCTVTVRIFCFRCDVSLEYWPSSIYISKPFIILLFVHCQRHISIGKR